MSVNPTWKLELVRSADMTLIRELRAATGRQLQLENNKPGTLAFQLPVDADEAYDLALRSVGVLASRDSIAVWSGAVTNIEDSVSDGAETTQVTCTGWQEELDHRYVRSSELAALSFTNVVGGSIAQTLIATVNAQVDSGATTRPTHLSFGSFSDTQTRTRAYKLGDNYGQLLTELIEVENGFDVSVDPLTRRLSTRAPTAFSDRKGVAFGYNADPYNLVSAQRTMDGTTIVNRENVVTQGGVVVSADDAAAIAQAGVMLEAWDSLSDVSDAVVAGEYANVELVYKRYGTITYQIVQQSLGDAPRPWDDYVIGDQVYLNVDRGRLRVFGQAVRVKSLGIQIDDQGNEIVAQMGLYGS